jgi:hypothetical protein
MRTLAVFSPILLGLVAMLVVVPAVLASKLHGLAPPGMSRFRCFGLVVNGGVGMQSPVDWRNPLNPYAGGPPLQEGETKEFRERMIAYRLILLGTAFLTMLPMWGLFMILNAHLKG